MTAPEHDDRPTALAPQHLRLFALLLDYGLALALVELGRKLTVPAGWDLHPEALQQSVGVGYVAALAGLLLLRDLPWGRSPGKWLCGIAATRAEAPGTPPPLWANLARNAALVLLPVEAVLVFTDPFCRRLGDRLAGTVVVLVPDAMPLYRRLLALSVLVLSFSLAFALAMRHNVFRSAVYTTAVEAAREAPVVADAVGSVEDVGGDPKIEPDRDVPQLARVRLTAEGSKGEADVVVLLRLDREAKRWRVQDVHLAEPGEEEPPPLVREAPGKP